MEKKDIFISYSSAQAAAAFQVRDFLEMYGISCWIAPDCISGGSDYSREIPSAIENCSIFVIMLSKKSQSSQWVRKELATAIQKGKKIMPFAIEKFSLNKEFNFYLSNVQRYDAFISKSEMLLNMVNEINLLLGRETVNPPEDKFNSFMEDIKNDEKTFETRFYNGLWNIVKVITPYGSQEAKNPTVKYSLNIVSVLTAIVFIPLILTSLSMSDGWIPFLGFTAAAFLVWYFSFIFCIRMGNLKIKNVFLITLGAVCGFAITVFIVFFIAVIILKNYVW